jgi:hypothetical protein
MPDVWQKRELIGEISRLRDVLRRTKFTARVADRATSFIEMIGAGRARAFPERATNPRDQMSHRVSRMLVGEATIPRLRAWCDTRRSLHSALIAPPDTASGSESEGPNILDVKFEAPRWRAYVDARNLKQTGDFKLAGKRATGIFPWPA